MNFKHIVLYIIAFGSINLAVGQQLAKSKNAISPVPNEEAYVHINSSLFFVGEYLYYKMYIKNATTNKLSTLSKIGYVELLQEDGTSIFKHQLVLENGMGQGDFFIPTTVVSGNYKLVGYTLNMLSQNTENFFQQDVSVLNPYRGNQTAINKSSNNIDSLNFNFVENNVNYQTNNKDFAVSVDKDNYSKRSKVALLFNANSKNSVEGNYSISIRKKDNVEVSNIQTTFNYIKNSNNINSNKTASSAILPELRGKLISGKAISKTAGNSVKSKKVTLSIPGEDYVFKVADVSENGNFYFNIDKPHSQNNALFQVIGDSGENFEIRLDSLPSINTQNLKFNQFTITPIMEKMIVERSVNNQIENAYYRVKPDTIKAKPLEQTYYGKTFTTYILDEFTRFPTMKETMVEIIDNAWVQTDNDGHSQFMVREPEGYGRTNNPLLLLVDGVFLQTHDLLANFKAAKVESISILRDRYYLGSQVFQGVMIVQTKENDFNKYLDENSILKNELLSNQPAKSYFTQEYTVLNKTETAHIPDLRRQLVWQPIINLKEGKTEINFYTSDISGEFEIRIEGFKADGLPVSILKSFVVE